MFVMSKFYKQIAGLSKLCSVWTCLLSMLNWVWLTVSILEQFENRVEMGYSLWAN